MATPSEHVAGLAHFLRAQAHPSAGFDAALAELQAGRKTGHWIWYVLPQLADLGQSELAQRFGITGREHAQAYLVHPVLGERLDSTLTIVVAQLQPPHARTVVGLLGSPLDAVKLVSSCTLFARAAQTLPPQPNAVLAQRSQRIAKLAGDVLDIAARQGLPACRSTLAALAGDH